MILSQFGAGALVGSFRYLRDVVSRALDFLDVPPSAAKGPVDPPLDFTVLSKLGKVCGCVFEHCGKKRAHKAQLTTLEALGHTFSGTAHKVVYVVRFESGGTPSQAIVVESVDDRNVISPFGASSDNPKSTSF